MRSLAATRMYAVAALLFAAQSATASLTLTTTGSTAAVTIPASNDFKSDLNGIGLTTVVTAADLTADTNGVLFFELIAAESGFDNSFGFDETAPLLAETSFLSWGSYGSAGPVAISAGEDLNDLGLFFFSDDGVDSGAPSDGFGIFTDGTSAVSGTTFYIAHDDQDTNPDDNHDDMIVKVTFEASTGGSGDPDIIPEPTMALVFGGLAAASVLSRRRRG